MRFLVTADDTTGALETAAACADLGWRAAVHPSAHVSRPGEAGEVDEADELDGLDGLDELVVLDLRSRHLPADEAASRLRPIVASNPALRAHKIDSTLRGNWVAEVEAIARAGRPVVLVPAFPAAGRTCVDGCVLVDGVPVHETAFGRDPRSPVTTSRPTDLVRSAVGAADPSGVRTALAEGRRIVVADASTDDDLDRYALQSVAHPEVVLVGPAAVVTALARQLRTATAGVSAASAASASRVESVSRGGGVLVVSASQHPNAIAQFAALRDAGAGRVTVVRPPADADPSDPDGVLADLAAAAHARLDADPSITTVVVVGGDTAASVLGAASVTVDGTLGVGIARGRTVLGGRDVRLVTKPGGFGDAGTLVGVLEGLLIR